MSTEKHFTLSRKAVFYSRNKLTSGWFWRTQVAELTRHESDGAVINAAASARFPVSSTDKSEISAQVGRSCLHLPLSNPFSSGIDHASLKDKVMMRSDQGAELIHL